MFPLPASWKFSLWTAVAAASLLASSRPSLAQDAKIDASARFVPDTARAGETVKLAVEAKIPEGYHLYSMTKISDGPMPLKIEVTGEGLEATGDWHAPTPKSEEDPNFHKIVEFYEGQVTHEHAFTVPASASADLSASILMRGQICNDSRCIPFKEKLVVNLAHEAGEARAQFTAPPTFDTPVADAIVTTKAGGSDLLEGRSVWGFLVVAFISGIGALVTPCVFPMIPITVSFFSKFAKVSFRRSLMMASIYSASIIGTFTFLGVGVSLLFKSVGVDSLPKSPAFNLFMTGILVLFAFNLFGLFEIQVPSALISATSKREQQFKKSGDTILHQIAGVFFMALTFTLVSFTCTVAFVSNVIAEATKGNWFYPALGMFAFSLAFSLPFFFLAIFPSLATKLKGKAGDWMVAVKVSLGFLELAGAFKYLSNLDLLWKWELITRPLVLSAWTGLFATSGLYLLRVFGLPHSDEGESKIGPIRMTFACAMLGMAALSASGLSHTRSMGGWIDGWLPPAVYPGQEETGGAGGSAHLEFIVNDIPGAKTKAIAANQPVFLDFTGYTCTNCRFMEASVFTRPDIRQTLEKTIRVSAYTDCQEAICEEQYDLEKEQFGTVALPFYVLLDPRDDETLATYAGIDRVEFAKFLEEGMNKYAKKSGGQAVAADKHADAKEPAAVEVKAQAPSAPVNFTFPGLADGKPFELATTRGSWVFVNFWASWCAPCKEELEHVFPQGLAKYPEVKFVSVAFDDEDGQATALAFAKKVDLLKYPALVGGGDIDEAGLDAAFDVSAALPISYLLDPEGRIVWMHKGGLDEQRFAGVLALSKK